jgi:hypothetical protein
VSHIVEIFGGVTPCITVICACQFGQRNCREFRSRLRPSEQYKPQTKKAQGEFPDVAGEFRDAGGDFRDAKGEFRDAGGEFKDALERIQGRKGRIQGSKGRIQGSNGRK